jgi:hypothetical protein
MVKLAKATINGAQWRRQLNLNYFLEINHYYAGWLLGADPELFQLSNVGGAIMNSLMKIRPNDIQLEEDESGSDLTTFRHPKSQILSHNQQPNKCHLQCTWSCVHKRT